MSVKKCVAKSRVLPNDAEGATLYAEFESEDRELANAGMHDYAAALAHEDAQAPATLAALLAGVTNENRHEGIHTGDSVGREAW